VRECSRVNAFAEHKRRAHGADDRGLAWESELLAKAIDGFDAGAVCADQVRHSEVFELVASPGELLVGRREEMKAADQRVNGRRGKFFFSEGERVDYAGMAAAGFSAAEILAHYYGGAPLQRLY